MLPCTQKPKARPLLNVRIRRSDPGHFPIFRTMSRLRPAAALLLALSLGGCLKEDDLLARNATGTAAGFSW